MATHEALMELDDQELIRRIRGNNGWIYTIRNIPSLLSAWERYVFAVENPRKLGTVGVTKVDLLMHDQPIVIENLGERKNTFFARLVQADATMADELELNISPRRE